MERSKLARALWASAFAGALLLLTVAPAWGQATGRIQGQVVEERTGRPLEGARITVEGSVRRAVTDAEGRYTLPNLRVGTVTIRVRLIGYGGRRQTLPVSPGLPATANFTLARSAISLDEIVVTGTGREVERRRLTASVYVINTQEIERAPVQDIAQLLQGRVAGMTVNATSAQAGTSSLINFRGISSVFGSQTPVIYVDGVRVDNDVSTASGTGGEQSSALADLLTTDIERIEVTKGGAASTLYGSDAASGVIQIFTKKGTPGRTRVTARIEQGFDSPELKYMFDTGLIYPDDIETGFDTNGDGTFDTPADPDFLKNNFFQSGHFQNYYLGVSGGGENITYAVSGRIQEAAGVQLKNQNELFTMRGAIQAEISDKTTVNFTANYTRTVFARIYNGDAIADPLTSFEVGDVFFFTGDNNFDDALTTFILPTIDEVVNRFRFTTGVNLIASDLFRARATVGLDYRTNQQREFSPIGAVFINGGEGQLQRFQRDFTSVTGDFAGTFSYPRTGILTSDFTFGVQGFRDDVSTTNITGQTFALPGAPDFDEAATIVAFETNTETFSGGFYLQEEIGLWDRVFLNGGVRFDANSTFGDQVDVEVYPKAGAAYLISDENFFQPTLGSVVNTLKLRFAYGKTGKFPTAFLRDRSFNATQFRGESAPRFNNPGNADLAPEVTSTIEGGFDIALIDNRVGIGLTYFDATTRDALFFVPEQPSTGLGTQLRNVGEISNKGIEIDANFQILNTDKVRWDFGLTYHAVDNEVTSLGGAAPFNITGQQRVDEGHPVGAWRLFTPFDSNGDGKLDDSELTFSGKSPMPTKSGSFSTSVTLFNNFTLSGSADWATGHEVFDFGSIWATFNNIFRRELVEEDYTFPIRFNTDGDSLGTWSQNRARSAFLLKGDWFKLRNISARWSLPSSVYQFLGVDRATLYGSVHNVKIWSATPLIDPELNGLSAGGNLQLGGRSSVTLSPPRQFRFGLEAVF